MSFPQMATSDQAVRKALLGVSFKTVDKYRQALMSKLNIHDVAGLTRHAIAEGIIEGNDPGIIG